jgi:hypothetical protein
MSRAFSKNKGLEIKLSPEEIEANMAPSPEQQEAIQGMGLFRGGKISMKKFKRGLSKAGNEIKQGAFKVNKTLKSSPALRAITKEVAPELAGMVANQGLTYLTGSPALGNIAEKGIKKGVQAGLKSEGYGLYAGAGIYAGARGRGFDDLKNQTLGNLKHQVSLNGYSRDFVDGMTNSKPIKSYYSEPNAPPSRGSGLNMIRGRGSLITHDFYQPPALVSQPNASNWLSANMLPPQYQKNIRG